jgi:predicted phosphoribosyltransferase
MPVAYELARALKAKLDVFIVRKLGVAGYEDLAVGAIASGGIRVVNLDIIRLLRINDETIARAAAEEERELRRREEYYREGRLPLQVKDKTVVLVSEGLAKGSIMKSAVLAVKERSPSRIVVAAAVASPASCQEFREYVDEIYCAITPEPFFAVGQWYEEFSPVSDEDVRFLLEKAGQWKLAA